MNKFRILTALAASIMLVACGKDSAEEQTTNPEPATSPPAAVVPAEPAASKPADADKEPGGNLEVSGSLSWNISTESAKLTCQRPVRRNPFRAQWFDGPAKIGLLASGFPLDDGSNGTETEVFRLTSLAGGKAENAPLTDVTLTVKEAGTDGGTIIFEIVAEGNIESGGAFRASGTCRG